MEETLLGENWENRVLPGGAAAVEAWLAQESRRETVVFATSGSSGTPKWVVHTRRTLEASARAVNAHLEVSFADRWLRAIPAVHVGGFAIHVRAALAGIAADVFEERWNVEGFINALRVNGTTLVSLVPAQIFDLVEFGVSPEAGLRAVVVGGGRLDSDLAAKARALGWPVLASYGSTEAGSQVATELPGRPGEMVLLPGWEIRDDAVRGAALADGILVESGSGLRLERIADELGWFVTGDRLEIDDRGNITEVKRLGRTVKVLGELVDLDAVEAVYRSAAPSGVRVALVAVPDLRSENALALAVEGEVGWVRSVKITGLFRPAKVRQFSSIPSGALGKPHYGEIASQFLSERACKPSASL